MSHLGTRVDTSIWPMTSSIDLKASDIASVARKTVLEMSFRARTSHIGSSLSCIDLLSAMYLRQFESHELGLGNLVIVSKGHAASAVYSVLNALGKISNQDIEDYCTDGAVLGGHVTFNHEYGIPLSTGSLGHALSFGVGIAYAKRLRNESGTVYVLGSDGECDSGAIWEAAMLAAHLELDNLMFVIDRNGLQSMKRTEETLKLEPLANKWKAFNWHVIEIQGHLHSEISEALDFKFSQPIVVIANTIKGFGISFMENSIEWHYRSPNKEEYLNGISELG